MTLTKLIGVALLCAVAVLFLREGGGRWATLAAAAGGILLLIAALSRYQEVLSLLQSYTGGGGGLFSEAATLSLKVVGVGLLTEVGADVCRDLGEGGLAGRVEMCGKAEILLLCLPTLARVLALAGESVGV